MHPIQQEKIKCNIDMKEVGTREMRYRRQEA